MMIKNKKQVIACVLAMLILFSSAVTPARGENDYLPVTGPLDSRMYTGSWQEAYQAVLNAHQEKILAYQNRKIEVTLNGTHYNIPCRPLSLWDLNGDGIEELIFMELAEEERGDLYIFSSGGSGAKCVCGIQGITQPGYDDFGLPFHIYTSSSQGGTLIFEYYEYEIPWMAQFLINETDTYLLVGSSAAEWDQSGEGEDTYYWNGSRVSEQTYQRMMEDIRTGKIADMFPFFGPNYSYYGLAMTLEDTVTMLGGSNSRERTTRGEDVYGYTIDKLATRKGPGTQYAGGGTYSVKNQWIKVLAKAWDSRNKIWWVKCEIPYRKEIRVLWTGYKRFDRDTLSLDDLPEEVW